MSESSGCISLRGVEVHNLKGVDLDIPHRKLVVFCGLSGSGKTSLALDTLYAEGQRRYIETFSAYTRQFFERLEKPAAERIDGIPPAIAVTHKDPSRSNRSTVGTATEAYDYLRLLLAKIGRVVCPNCNREVRRESPESAAASLAELPAGTRFMVTFAARNGSSANPTAMIASLKEEGFIRAIIDRRMVSLGEPDSLKTTAPPAKALDDPTARRADAAPLAAEMLVVVDRLRTGGTTPERLRESLETAFAKGDGTCQVLIDLPGKRTQLFFRKRAASPLRLTADLGGGSRSAARCAATTAAGNIPMPEPRLFSFNSPLGACPQVRRLRQRDRHRHGPDRARPEQVDPRGGHRSLEHAGLCPRAEGTARAGRRLRAAASTCRFAS